jgi:hypothetical protein
MAEPVTLYNKAGKAQIVVSPSEVRRLEAEGWTQESPAPEPAAQDKPKFMPVPKQTRKAK